MLFGRKQRGSETGEQPLYVAEGYNGNVKLFPTRIEIHPKYFIISAGDMMNGVNGGVRHKSLAQGVRTFYLASITGMTIQRRLAATKGYIRFIVSGSASPPTTAKERFMDLNCVMIKDHHQFEQFDYLRKYIEKIRGQDNGSMEQRSATLSVADEIRKLGDLRDSGLISQEQFEQQRDKLLS